jgi:hypothetical protein
MHDDEHDAPPSGTKLTYGMSSDLSSPQKRKREGREKKKEKKLRRSAAKGTNHTFPLTGWTLAISTLNIKGEKHANQEYSYKSIQELSKSLGATVTGQVHNRVSALLCTSSSLHHATQRVRKAVQRGVPLVDITWLFECKKHNRCIDMKGYLFDESEVGNIPAVIDDESDSAIHVDYEKIPENGWSDAVDLGCCCVCHENIDPDCPWCADCSVNRVTKRVKVSESQELEIESN